jgi:hypothetical protein
MPDGKEVADITTSPLRNYFGPAAAAAILDTICDLGKYHRNAQSRQAE